jgi:predicted DsbA family dithiol-disulfide isomerase
MPFSGEEMRNRFTVTVYFDYCCPFCYLGKLELERLERELGLDLDWRYYQMHRDYPDAGLPLNEALGPGLEKTAWQSIQYHFEQRQMGRIRKPDRISNTVRAQLATEFARRQGLFREFQTAVYETYFIEGRGIGTSEEVIAIGQKVGIDARHTRRAFNNLGYLSKIREDDQEARRNGVVGIPTLMVGGRLALGAQSYEDMKYFITRWGK